MARFIGRLRGGRGEVSRLGTPASGIRATVSGWNVGVQVSGGDVDGEDVFYVYANGGSNRQASEILVAVISLDASGAVVSETPAENEARKVREAAAKAPELVPEKKAAKREPKYRPLVADEVAALKRYASANGRTWKSSLRSSWEIADATLPGPLYSLRNSHGPSWLVEVKL